MILSSIYVLVVLFEKAFFSSFIYDSTIYINLYNSKIMTFLNIFVWKKCFEKSLKVLDFK